MIRSTRNAASIVALTLIGGVGCGGDSSGPAGPPTPPTNIQGAATSISSVHLAWSAVNGASSYIIDRTSPGLPAARTTAATNALDDSGLLTSTTYAYQIATVRGTDTSTFSAPVAVATRSIGATATVLRTDITASRALAADTLYIISGVIHVRSGVTLTIAAGTRLVGDTSVGASTLWISRGGKIDARGTATSPIVFTSQRAAGARAAGDWGGVVIVGNAPVSRNAADAQTYGRTGTAYAPESYGGGTDAADNSGTLRFVRIEFAGAAPNAGDDQMAGLTLYAVGRGTTVEYVQTLESLGSGFQWYGGTVDGRYLVSYEAGDDHFGWAEGYSGRDQFGIAFQSHQPAGRAENGFPSSTPRGLQGYGCDVNLAGCATYLAAPLSDPLFANFTVVGAGPNVYPAATALRSSGVTFARGSGGSLVDAVVARWPSVGLNVREAATDTLRRRDSLYVGGVLFTDNAGGNFDPTDGASFGQQANFPAAIAGTAATASLFAALPATPTSAAAFDWTPTASSPLRSGGLTTLPARVAARAANFFGSTLAGTAYIGAADPAGTNRWWQGWTSYMRN